MEEIVSPIHRHPLTPFTGTSSSWCKGCCSLSDGIPVYIDGGYRCKHPWCERPVFHKECAKPLPEINHSSHPHHPLKLIILDTEARAPRCSLCKEDFKFGYCCSICDFKLDFGCALRQDPFVFPESSYVHEHRLRLTYAEEYGHECEACGKGLKPGDRYYKCQECKFIIHMECVDFGQEAYHTYHPKHPLKPIICQVPDYTDKKCLLCEKEFDRQHQLHHCDVCNFSICRRCMKDPPPIGVESPKTHEHQLHLVPRLIIFTCDACGTLGDRSPYFCLPCNFMIHRECIGLPRVIIINRHDHRISYIRRLGDGEWKCKVCRKKVDGFYGGYTCSKCPSFSVHARCATRKDVWDMIELEGTPEEEIPDPFMEIDDNTIKHFGHDHNLKINKYGMILPESTLCVACVFQICSEPFYKCEECDFILHKKCANLPRKKRHVRSNQPFSLRTDCKDVAQCSFCKIWFSGFRYEAGTDVTLDVRCASISDSVEHESHPHPLYYNSTSVNDRRCRCSRCGEKFRRFFRCDGEYDYILDARCAVLPKKVMIKRYDDHPLFLSYGDMNVDERYWCEACETKVDPKKGFYTCNDCGVVLHISCVVGDFSCIMPGSSGIFYGEEVVSNTSICRKICYVCKDRCKLPSVYKILEADVYMCSFKCLSEEYDV